MSRRFATSVCLVAFFWGFFSLTLVKPAWAKGRSGIGKGIASAAGGLAKGISSRSGTASNLINKARDLGNGNLGSAINKVRDLGNGNVVGRVKEAVQDVRDLRNLPGDLKNVVDRAREVVKVAEVVASNPVVNRALDLNEFQVLNGIVNKNGARLSDKIDLSKFSTNNTTNPILNRINLGNLATKKPAINPILSRTGIKLSDIVKPVVVDVGTGGAAGNAGTPVEPAPVSRGERIVQILNAAGPALANLRQVARPVVVGGGSVVVAAPAAPVAAPAAVEPTPTAPVVTDDVEMLSVRLVNLGDEATKQGPLFRLTFRNNASSSMSKPVVVVLAASKDTELSAGSLNAVAEVSGIEAGKTTTVDVRLPEEVLTMGRDVAGQPAPFATLFAVIDAGNTLNESNEANNVLTQSANDLRLVD